MLSFALAKVGVAICVQPRLEASLESITQDHVVYPDEMNLLLESDDRDMVSDLANAWARGDWNGDMDRIPQHYLGLCQDRHHHGPQ